VSAHEWTAPDGQRADQPIHVTPIGDLREHPLDVLCPCMPRTLPHYGTDWLCLDGSTTPERTVVVHNSYDGRETGEVCRKALDLLGAAIAHHGHEWTPTERDAYYHAIHILNMHWPAKDAGARAT
jgi:hypothetical protein